MSTRWARLADRLQLAVVAAVLVAAALAWRAAPARVPVHWNVHGEVDGWGSRTAGLWLLPAILVMLSVLQRVLPRIDPGRSNYPNFAGAWSGIWLAATVFVAAIHAAVILETRSPGRDLARLAPVLIGVLFVVVGGFMGKLRPNWFIGFRTPWTLSSKTSWVRTHRLAGFLFIATGIVVCVAAIARPPIAVYAAIGSAVATALVCTIYSYVVWRDAPDKVAPAGSAPAEEGSEP